MGQLPLYSTFFERMRHEKQFAAEEQNSGGNKSGGAGWRPAGGFARTLFALACSALLLEGQSLTAEAAHEAEAVKEARPRLIQTTTPQEECDSLIALDILQVMPVQTGNQAQAQQNNLPAIVQIEAGDYLGSGVIFEITQENIIIISNRHLLECGDSAKVTFYQGTEAASGEIRLSGQYDFGLLTVPREAVGDGELMKLRRVGWDNECSMRAGQGDRLFIIGSRDGPGSDIYEGTILDTWWYSEDFGTHMLYNGCNAEHGISGGGTFDEHGHYLGMLSAGNGSETLSLPLITVLQEYTLLAGELSQFGG